MYAPPLPRFLRSSADSDDLQDLTLLLEHVKNSDVLVLFQTVTPCRWGCPRLQASLVSSSAVRLPAPLTPSHSCPAVQCACLRGHSKRCAHSKLRGAGAQGGVLQRPYCILEVWTAIAAGVPIVALMIRGKKYGGVRQPCAV